jgi:fatty acid desaturase
MERLPHCLQRFLTELTGKAGPHQEETFRHTTASRLSLTLAQFAVGGVGGGLLMHAGGHALQLVPAAQLMTVGAVRAFQTTYLHQGSHGNLVKKQAWNDFLAEMTSVLGWLAPLAVYREEHGRHHGGLATAIDPDLQLLLRMGIKPGRTRQESWKHFRWLLASPRFHISMTLTRMEANLVSARRWRRVSAWVQGLGLLGLAGSTGLWLEFLMAYVMPMTVLCTIGAILQTLSEHMRVHTGQGRDPKRVVWSRLTRNRYSGEIPSDERAGWPAWARWWLRMILIHGTFRVWVVPLDLAVHHWHHARPGDSSWPRVAFAYRDGRGAGSASDDSGLEVWGLIEAINLTFDHLALVPPDADLGDPNSYGFIDPDLLGM